MTTIVDLVGIDVEERFAQLEGRLVPGARFRISGPVGAGKTMLTGLLAERCGAVVVEPPELGEDDAVAHALLQASRQADVPIDGKRPIRENVGAIADVLADAGQAIVLRLPPSWRLDRQARRAHQQRLLSSARDFIEAWFSCDHIAVVLAANRPDGMPRCQEHVRLPSSRARAEMLEDDSLWGAYAEPARALLQAMGSVWNDPSAVALRLAVGLVALGDAPDAVAQRLFLNETPGSFVSSIVKRAGAAQLTPALLRFGQIRVPIPRGWLRGVVACPDAHLPLFSQCLGYGEDTVRISASVRSTLLSRLARYRLSETDVEETHERLADRHESVDGVRDPDNVGAEGIVHWLEKVHHLAHGGEGCAERWAAQELHHRDLLCARARVLSKIEHRYLEAAALYERIVTEIDEEDGYAWHYLGFNLDRAAVDRARAEEVYRRAIDLDPTNPWWNSRYITFLIGQARFIDADSAWTSAMQSIDPEGDETHHDPDLALHIHRWVARTWLDHGEVKRARRVLDRVLPPAQDLPEVRAVDHQVRDAEEALSLGASVRPPEMPIEQRWRRAVLPDEDERGEALSRWFVGRVEAVDAAGVHVVFATTDEDPSARRLLRKVVGPDIWRAASTIPVQAASGLFVEIGEYGDVVLIDRVVAFSGADRGSSRAGLRYLERWAAR